MVNRLIFLMLLPLSLAAVEFSASVSRNPINVGESFTLILTLKDATAQGSPDLELLKKSFSILSQKQSYNTIIINGDMSTGTTWKLGLVSQKEGDLEIPQIKIDTNKGVFFSDAIPIIAKKNAGTETDDVLIKTELSQSHPFKNEPFVYTVRLMSKKDLVDIKMPKFSLDNAHVETHGEPKTFHKVIDGVNVGIIEFDYLITPLKPGVLKIPPNLVQGGIPGKRKVYKGTFFEDDFDPFAMMQGFDRISPFSLVTEEVVVDVQPQVSGINPWVPAEAVMIQELWDPSQTFQVGEPFTRSFKIEAIGLKSSQLPSLNDQHLSDSTFKIYSDKPDFQDLIKENKLISHRLESYTLVPQKEGELVLPAVSLTWWDVVHNKQAITSVPPRTVSILPPKVIPENKFEAIHEAPPEQISHTDPILYSIIGGLLMLFISALLWAVTLQKKVNRLKKMPSLKPTRMMRKAEVKGNHQNEILPDLNPT